MVENKRKIEWGELFRYTLVGLSSSLVQYVIYSTCYFFTQNYIFANVMAFIVSVAFSCYWNRQVVFNSVEHTTWWVVLFKNYILYFTTGILMTNVLSFVLIDSIKISPYVSPLIIIVVLYPLNYVTNKLWIYRKKN